MHLAPLIIDLSVILAVAGIMSFVFQKIHQPVVLGYILAGVIVGPFTPPFQLVHDVPSIQTWAELGVIFLMFTLGLEFSFRKLLSVGITAGVSAGLEVIFFLLVGYGIGIGLGWSSMDSIFLGAMLSISSTTIIIKALDELKLKNHRFASLIFGILIVEDLFAILLLVGLTTIASTETFSLLSLGETALNLILVVGSWFIMGYFIVPRIMSYIARKGTNEMLTLVSIGLCLLLVVVASRFGYSAALGAFIMGSILAETKVIHSIENLMAPLRDLFGAIFFVSIGMLIDPQVMWDFKGTILLLCLVTIFGKIFITSFGALLSGQTLKNSLQVGFGLAQIGEFSFIIAGLGVSLNATSSKLYPIGVAVSLVTTFTTPYLIKYSGPIADKIECRLPVRIKNWLSSYVIWWEHKKTNGGEVKNILKLLSRWLINGIIVTVIFNNSFKALAPKILINLKDLNQWHLQITWIIAFILSSPFIWGMLLASRKTYLQIDRSKNLIEAIIVMSFPILTTIWLGIITTKYFPLKYVFPATVVALAFIYFYLYRKLEFYYNWFESTFLSTFEKPPEEKESNLISNLAPWDTHLVSIEVHPNANFVNKTLLEVNLRNRFGINVVAIKRGVQTIVAPGARDKILPADTLVVLGSDEQLDKIRSEFEAPLSSENNLQPIDNYLLKHMVLAENSAIIGKTIYESEIRERFQALVVGVERSNFRIMNPDIDFKFRPMDIVWIVGEQTLLDELISELT